MTLRHALFPAHPQTGVTAIGFTSRGPIWPVMGGSEPEPESAEDQEDAPEEPDEDQGGEQGEEEEDKPLGPKGEKALQAEKEKRRGEAERRRKVEAERDELKKQLAEAKKPAKEGEEDRPDADAIRRQIQEEMAAETARERVLDKIELKAAKGFTDPADAVVLLLKQHDVKDFLDDGKPDIEAIQDALDALLESKPYLGAAQGGKRFKGSADGGARPPKPTRPKSLNEAVANRFQRS